MMGFLVSMTVSMNCIKRADPLAPEIVGDK